MCVSISGSPRVDDDEEEEDFDDLEYEFDYGDIDVPGYTRRAHTRLASSTSRDSSSQVLEIPLLTYSEEVFKKLSPSSLFLPQDCCSVYDLFVC